MYPANVGVHSNVPCGGAGAANMEVARQASDNRYFMSTGTDSSNY